MPIQVSKSEFDQLLKKAGRQGLGPAGPAEKSRPQGKQKKPVRRYFESPGKKYLCIGLCLLVPTALPAIVKVCTKPGPED